jgi:hypothetical protein
MWLLTLFAFVQTVVFFSLMRSIVSQLTEANKTLNQCLSHLSKIDYSSRPPQNANE